MIEICSENRWLFKNQLCEFVQVFYTQERKKAAACDVLPPPFRVPPDVAQLLSVIQ